VYALDTNTVSYFVKGRGRVAQRLLGVSPRDIGLPAVVLYELEYGAARAGASRQLRGRLDAFLNALCVLPFGAAEARAASRVRVELEKLGQPIGPIDVLVAATALEHGAILVTHNTTEFGRVPGLRLDDWY
jgi:tRNA(fMet)-specific endonuclease VapC